MINKLLMVVLLLSTAACEPYQTTQGSNISSRGKQVGQLRGFETMQKIIGSRIFKDGFNLSSLISGSDPLVQLLGDFENEGVDRKYQNGDPNGLNIFLWHAMMDKLTNSLVADCDSDSSLENNYMAHVSGLEIPITDDLGYAMQRLCGLQAGDQFFDTNVELSLIWDSVMYYDASQEHFKDWESFMQGEEMLVELLAFPREKRAQEWLRLGYKAMLFHPRFLLEP